MVRNKIKIMQWNARSIKNKILELQNNWNVHIILFAETWLNCKDTSYLKGFYLIRKDRAHWRGGDVATAVTKSHTVRRKTFSTAMNW
jgi:hypothetical protein